VFNDVNCSDGKKPPTSTTHQINQCGVPGKNSPYIAMAMPAQPALTISTVRKPKRPSMREVAAFMKIEPNADAHVIEPERNGVMPRPSCNASGNRNGTAPRPMRNGDPPATLA